MRKLMHIGAVTVMVLAAQPARAQGGPPLITDDPDTPGPGYWEVNLAAVVTRYTAWRSTELPRLDVNYGAGRRVQLKCEAPWLRTAEGGQIRTGAGNAAAGVKYRFLGEEGRLVAWSIYPQIEFRAPRGSVRDGVGEDATSLFLPTEITIERHHLEVNGEVGRWLRSGGWDAWEYGVSSEGHVVSRLEVLGEIHVTAGRGHDREVVVNIGARPKVTRQLVLLLAAGRGVGGDPGTRPRLRLYSGVQFNLPGLYAFDSTATATRRARVDGAR